MSNNTNDLPNQIMDLLGNAVIAPSQPVADDAFRAPEVKKEEAGAALLAAFSTWMQQQKAEVPSAKAVADEIDLGDLACELQHAVIDAIDIEHVGSVVAEQIDVDEIAEKIGENIELDLDAIAERIDVSAIAEEITVDAEDVAVHMDASEVASHIEVDAEEVAANIDLRDLARHTANELKTSDALLVMVTRAITPDMAVAALKDLLQREVAREVASQLAAHAAAQPTLWQRILRAIGMGGGK